MSACAAILTRSPPNVYLLVDFLLKVSMSETMGVSLKLLGDLEIWVKRSSPIRHLQKP